MSNVESSSTRAWPHQALGLITGFLLAVAFLAISFGSIARTVDDPRIVPPNGKWEGMTYGEWLAASQQYFYAVPAADNAGLPGNEDKLPIGQPRHVWFLAGTLPVMDRHLTVPSGTALYVTIFNVEWDNFLCADPDTDYTLDELRAIAKSVVDTLKDIEVAIDGVPVPNVTAYRSISPVFTLTLPAQNIVQTFGCTDALPGTYGPAIADGRALLVKPLSVGEHTIHQTAVAVVDPTDPSQDVDVDIMLHVSVVPRGRLD